MLSRSRLASSVIRARPVSVTFFVQLSMVMSPKHRIKMPPAMVPGKQMLIVYYSTIKGEYVLIGILTTISIPK